MEKENKKYIRQMICKSLGLIIIPYLFWLLLAFIDFTKEVSYIADKVLVILQIPIMAVYMISNLAFPRFSVVFLMLCLFWITVMLITSNAQNKKTVSNHSSD